MIDIHKFINALKGSWIKRILELENNNPLKLLYYSILNKLGGNLIFECNLKENDLNTLFKKSTFLKDILIAWRNIKFDDSKITTLNTIIWNNSNIRSGDNPIFYRNWLNKGIKTFEDIFDTRTKQYFSFKFIQYIYSIPRNDYLKYLSLINSIPNDIKNNLTHDSIGKSLNMHLLEKVLATKRINKMLYDIQINHTEVEIKQKEKWESILENHDIEWKSIFRLSFETTVDNKLRNFNYKYLMGIVRTNKELFRFAIVNSTLCDFCGRIVDNVKHLFWDCEHTQAFLGSVIKCFKFN